MRSIQMCIRDSRGSYDSSLHQVDVAVHRHKAGAEVCIVNAEHILQNLSLIHIYAMADARHKLDWPAQFALALDPEKAERFYNQVCLIYTSRCL